MDEKSTSSKTVWLINQYASTPQTGTGGRTYYLAKELAAQGHQVLVIASDSHHLLINRKSIDSKVEFHRVEGFTFAKLRMPSYSSAHSVNRIYAWFRFALALVSFHKYVTHRPDVILYSSPSLIGYLGAERLTSATGAKLVFEVRDIWPLTLTQLGGYSVKHPFIRFLQWVEDRAYRNSSIVISNLKNSVQHMVSRGMDSDKFLWISNGYSRSERTNPAPLPLDVTSRLPTDKFLVGYTGTFGLANSLDTLVSAAEILVSVSEIEFIFVGGGKDKTELIESVTAKGLTNIHFIDYIQKSQIQTMLAKFDVLVVGGKKDPMYRFGVSPNKLFDYFSASKPIVYYIDSGEYRPVTQAAAGIEVEPENPELLAAAILELYKLPKEALDTMGLNGYAEAVEQYEYGVLAKKLSDTLFQSDLTETRQ